MSSRKNEKWITLLYEDMLSINIALICVYWWVVLFVIYFYTQMNHVTFHRYEPHTHTHTRGNVEMNRPLNLSKPSNVCCSNQIIFNLMLFRNCAQTFFCCVNVVSTRMRVWSQCFFSFAFALAAICNKNDKRKWYSFCVCVCCKKVKKKFPFKKHSDKIYEETETETKNENNLYPYTFMYVTTLDGVERKRKITISSNRQCESAQISFFFTKQN